MKKSKSIFEMYAMILRLAGQIEAQEWAQRNLDENEKKLLQRELDKQEEKL